MLHIDHPTRFGRRRLLQVGSLALGGLSLASLLEARAAETASHLTGKSVIFLFLQGGPSQFETFDPKLDAAEGIRTITATVPTSLAGVRFGATLPKLAALADRLTVVRSYRTDNALHNVVPIVSPASLNANIGALLARVAGSTHPVTGMPTNALLFPQSVCNDVAQGQGRGDISATGAMGSGCAPFVPGGGGKMLGNLRLSIAPDRFHDRRELSAQLDGLRRRAENEREFRDYDRFQEQACEVLLSGRVAEALDLTREDPRVVARYDTAGYVPSHGWKRAQRGGRGYYTGHAKSLGKSLLMARRLCEAGCGFVTVHCGYEGVWDMHADGNNLNMIDGMEAVGRPFDHAVAAFIADLEARGLTDKILLVASGEMGRTPRVNRNGGRDHWPRLAPLVFHGGGMPAGRVLGQSTRDGGEPASEAFTTAHLISTILHTVFDVGRLRLLPAFASIARLGEVPPIG